MANINKKLVRHFEEIHEETTVLLREGRIKPDDPEYGYIKKALEDSELMVRVLKKAGGGNEQEKQEKQEEEQPSDANKGLSQTAPEGDGGDGEGEPDEDSIPIDDDEPGTGNALPDLSGSPDTGATESDKKGVEPAAQAGDFLNGDD